VKSVSSPFPQLKGAYQFYNRLNPDFYAVESPDAIEPSGGNSHTVFRYGENLLSAGIAYSGDYKTCALGFPFETIRDESGRNQLMRNLLDFMFGTTSPVFLSPAALVDSVRLRYVPDRRDNVYEITAGEENGNLLVRGFTSVPEAQRELMEAIRKENPGAVDSIVLLPDKSLDGKLYGAVNVSVADLRMESNFGAEMGTQLLLGMPLQVLQHDGWYRVKTPEGYVAWMEKGVFVPMDKETFNRWINAEKIIFTGDYGFAYETPDEHRQRVSDLVFGNLLKYEGDSGNFYRVSYPDGRQAYVLKTQSRMYGDWLSSVSLTEESIIREALLLKGIPYVWGGTSVKGMDCSGFSKTVFLKHGVMLRRDASQQAKTGLPVDINQGYENLRPGDLLFFGTKAGEGEKEYIRHVAIYIGNREFIHASGFVRINSLDPSKPHYDKDNAEALVRASRIIGAAGTEGIWNIGNHKLFRTQE
jgi:cell wall-associated NlpC family hydrolase